MALAAAALLLLVGRAAASLYTDWIWYDAMGAASLWRARTATTIALRFLSALAGGLFVFVNLYVVRQSVISLVLPRRVANLEIGEEVPGRYLMLAVLALSIVFGALLSIPSDNWLAAELIRYGAAFGETDPYAQLDLGFYVYWLPFEISLFYWALFTILLGTALVVFLYALTPSLRWERGTLYVSTYVRRHLTVLGTLLLLALAWSYRLDAYRVMLSGSGADGAFTAIDHSVSIPAAWGLAVFTMCAALLVLLAGWAGQVRVASAAIAAVFVLSIVLRQVAPTLVRRFGEPMDPAVREHPYVATRGGYTRRAFAVDRIIASDSAVGFASIGEAAMSVPIWDARAVVRAIHAGPRPDQMEPSVGWQGSPNGTLAVVPDQPVARDDAPPVPWPVSRVLSVHADSRGGIVRASALGQATPEEAVVATVFIHEGDPPPLRVADTTGALSAPPISAGWSRIAFAWSLQDFRLLVEDLPFPNPRLVMRRSVRDRVRALAPFFVQGSALYPVVHSDTLHWMLDLYSATTSYPLSHGYRAAGAERRYFQHAATAIVNATSGRVALVAAEALDPIARTWTRRFPALFTAADDIAPGLLAARPPAVDGVRAQASAFARFGTRSDPLPRRQIAWDFGADTALMEGTEVLFAPPAPAPLFWTIPVLDDAERVLGIVTATGGESPRVFWRRTTGPELRWTAAIEQLRRLADTATGPEREGPLTLGRARAVPIGGRLAIVQPVYTWRPRGAPSLLRVVATIDGEPRIGRTLAAIAGMRVAAGLSEETPPPEFRARVDALYEAMRSAMRRGDWLGFGAAYDSLGTLLGRPPR
ncbi:MAG TPA: UPF0182 family protein [Gemmatimonadaceae bacterium]|nr:UPF0182 family protein [Gemmatimonadaceae bacterium]